MTNRLKELRLKNKIPGTKMAEHLNISPVYYYDLEKGVRRLNEDLLNALANFFSVTTDYLLGRTDDPNIVVVKENQLPYELRGKVDAIGIVQNALDKGISKETIEEILNFVDKLKKDPK